MEWINGITMTCFAASYSVSLAVELSRLFFQTKSRALVMRGFAVAGLTAHSLYLIARAQSELARALMVPLSSWHDFCLLAAWVLAAAYLGLSWRKPQAAIGIFLLPLVLGLIALAFAWQESPAFAASRALNVWRTIHGLALLFGTAAVSLGFAMGIMYLVQSFRLKHKLPPRPGFRMPSLEWLQRFNREALIVSTALLATGLLSGVVLNLGSRSEPGQGIEWTDPVVLSSGVLFLWLLVMTIFEALYRPARQGKKVAYITLASFVFLLLTLGFVLFGGHATDRAAGITPPGGLPDRRSGGVA